MNKGNNTALLLTLSVIGVVAFLMLRRNVHAVGTVSEGLDDDYVTPQVDTLPTPIFPSVGDMLWNGAMGVANVVDGWIYNGAGQ